MSKADQMFKELGYDIEIWTETVEYKMDRYAIVFNLTNKSVEIQNYFSPKSYITMQELQAINKKVKELRMDRMSKETSPLKKVRQARHLTLRDLYFFINQEIRLTRISDLDVAREVITADEIKILNKYLDLSDQEIEELEDMEINKFLKENSEKINKIIKLVPKDLEAGQEIVEKCPFCGSKLTVSRANINGHLWIICEKEGVILCE